MTNAKISTARKQAIKDVVTTLLHTLKPFGVYIYHTAKTGSTYLKFRDYGLGSIRVGDHDGREKYHYRYNVRLDHQGDPTVINTAGWPQHFYGRAHLDQLLQDVRARSQWQKAALKREQTPPANFDTTVPPWGEPMKEATDGQR